MSTYSLEDIIPDSAGELEHTLTDEYDEWPFTVEPKGRELVEGHETKMYTDGGDGVYAGEFARKIIEARRYRPESYTWLGYTRNSKKGIQEAGIPHEALIKHTAIFGNSGYGKSTSMKNMMYQWAEAGHGYTFIDPKGDDSPALLRMLPERRLDDVVWMEPNSAKNRKTVGFNALETLAEPGTQEQKSEADAITSNFISLIESRLNKFSPQMEGVLRAVLRQLIEAEEEYTLEDVYEVLSSETQREVFLDMYGDELSEMDYEFLDSVEEREIDMLTSELQQIVSHSVFKEVFIQRDSQLNIAEAIEDGKIILANFSNVEKSDLRFLTASVVRRIWSKIKARKDVSPSEREDYFLCIDEFDETTKAFEDEDSMMNIETILSTARAYRLGVLIANQNPQQLAEDIREYVFGNCMNIFSFYQQNYQDAQPLAEGIQDIDARQIMNLKEFNLFGRLLIDGEKTEPQVIITFPQYPPLREEEEAEEVIDKSFERYGVEIDRSAERDTDEEEQQRGVLRYRDSDDSGGQSILSGEGYTMFEDTVLAALASAEDNPYIQTEHGVREDILKDIMEKHVPEASFSDIKSELLSELLRGDVEERRHEGRTYYKTTRDGYISLIKSFDCDRELAVGSLEALSSMGYYAVTPSNDTDRSHYDFLAYPSLSPAREGRNIAQVEQLKETFKNKFTEIANNFGDNELVVSVLSDIEGHPERLPDALGSDSHRHVLFATDNSDTSRKKVKRHLLEKPYFARQELENGLSLYTKDVPINVGDGELGLVGESNVHWVQTEDNEFLLRNSDNKSLVSFENKEQLNYSAGPEAFPFYTNRTEEGVNVHESGTGDVESRYESLSALEEEFSIVNEPLIPDDYFLSEATYPDESDWSLLCIQNGEDDETEYTLRYTSTNSSAF